jgi:hypothetical protein
MAAQICIVAPGFRKQLALEVANRRSAATVAAKCLAFLSWGDENGGAHTARKGALPGNKIVDDDAAQSFGDFCGQFRRNFVNEG